MTTSWMIFIFVFSYWVVWAWDNHKWRRLPLTELLKRADPRSVSTARRALRELARRGQPIQHLLAAHASQLVDASGIRRMASLQVIRSFFPREASLLKGYSASADLAACKQAAAPLLATLPGRPENPGGEIPEPIEIEGNPGCLGGVSLLLLFASFYVYWKGATYMHKTWHVMLTVVSLNALGLLVGGAQLWQNRVSKGGAKGSIAPLIVTTHGVLLLVFIGVPLWRMWRS